MRRSRFTVTASRHNSNEIEKLVILAYGPTGAGDYFTKRGYTVLRVTAGDYRKQARADGGFTIDQAALKDAIDLLGIKLPVRIRFNGRVGNTNGNYRFEGTHHNIMLKTYHSADEASSTLWHELTHAMQAEREGHTTAWEWGVARRQEKRASRNYRSRPSEIEARDMSATMADVPLCR